MKITFLKNTGLIISLLYSIFIFGQIKDDLILKIKENQNLMKSDMEKGFKELLVLEDLAKKEKNYLAELEVKNNKAYYYFVQADYDGAYKTAQNLEKEAREIKNVRLEAIAMNRLGITLNFLELYEQAEKKLIEAQKFIINNDFENKNLVLANNYQFLSDLYTHTEKYDKAISYIKKTIPEYQKINNSEERKKQIAKGYGNIGLQYLAINLDSAAYYFHKSIGTQDVIAIKNYNVANYTGLGEVYYKKKDYKKSLEFLKKAENLNEQVKDSYYMTTIYDFLQDIYKNLGNLELHNKYKVMYLENLQRENTEKLNGATAVAKETQKESIKLIKKSKNITQIAIISSLIALISIIFLYYITKNIKNKNKEKEEIQKELLIKEKEIESLEAKNNDLLAEVIEHAKNNNVHFYSKFLELCPDFEKKLLAINNQLTHSELEFCALLKLNFSAKEIANFRYISIRTAQNKKYRIRTKLNIANDQDTNVFFSNL